MGKEILLDSCLSGSLTMGSWPDQCDSESYARALVKYKNKKPHHGTPFLPPKYLSPNISQFRCSELTSQHHHRKGGGRTELLVLFGQFLR